MGFRNPAPPKCADIAIFMSNTIGAPDEKVHDFHHIHNPVKTNSFQTIFHYKNDEKQAHNHDKGKEQNEIPTSKKKVKQPKKSTPDPSSAGANNNIYLSIQSRQGFKGRILVQEIKDLFAEKRKQQKEAEELQNIKNANPKLVNYELQEYFEDNKAMIEPDYHFSA